MTREQAQQAVAELIAAVYPANMHQVIMEGFAKAPNADDPAYWENIRLGLSQQQTMVPKGAKKEAGDWLAEVGSNDVTITGYKGTETAVQIPAQIEGKPVTAVGRRVFWNKKITSVTIPDSVTSIGDSAFAKNELTSVTIPSGLTSIGEEAFTKNKLSSINIPGKVTSIGKSAFAENKITSVTIPNSITSIGDSVFELNLLASITIPGSVTSIGDSAFKNNLLTEISLPSGLTSIGAWAFGDNKITGLTVPASLKSIGDKAFYGNKITSVTVPDSLTNIGKEAFGNASVLKAGGAVAVEGKAEKDFEVSPSKDGKSVVITAYKVQRHINQASIPSHINGKPVTGIGVRAFYKKGAKNVIIPDSVTVIGDSAFEKNLQLVSINIPAGVTSIGKRAFAECSNLAVIAIPDSVTVIGDSAFEGCSRLVSVTLGKGITSIGTKVFKRSELSKGIIIPDSVKSIGEEAFFKSKLSSVTIGKGVTDIGNEAFAGCNLSSISFSGSVKNIGEEAFADNETAEGDFMVLYSDNAKSIIITQYKGKGKALQLPSKLRGLPVTDIQWRAFNNDITSAVIPDNVSLNSNWSGVSNPSIIRTITIGNNVTIDGNKFDRINAEKIKDFSKGPKFIPLDKLYEKNGRKAGTFTLGKDQWDFKPR